MTRAWCEHGCSTPNLEGTQQVANVMIDGSETFKLAYTQRRSFHTGYFLASHQHIDKMTYVHSANYYTMQPTQITPGQQLNNSIYCVTTTSTTHMEGKHNYSVTSCMGYDKQGVTIRMTVINIRRSKATL